MGSEISHDFLPAAPPPADFAAEYTFGKKLGVGVTAEVRLCTHNASGQQYAAKIVSKSLFAKQPRLKERLEKEVAILKEAEHPNILKLLGCHETEDSIIMLLELAPNGELFDYLVRRGKLPEAEAKKLFTQLISAVQYCHANNVCHRDIKPENVLLTAAGDIKLADFGFATHMHCVSDGSENWADTSCGSPHYASPEVIQGQRYQGPQADTWSCGVMLFALLTGGLPFDGDSVPQLLRAVKAGHFVVPKWVDPQAAALIKAMLVLRPEDRPSLAAVASHPWLQEPPAPPPVMMGRFAVTEIPQRPLVPQPVPSRPDTPTVAQQSPPDRSCSAEGVAAMGLVTINSAGSIGEMMAC